LFYRADAPAASKCPRGFRDTDELDDAALNGSGDRSANLVELFADRRKR
jgi:hypothetical protein